MFSAYAIYRTTCSIQAYTYIPSTETKQSDNGVPAAGVMRAELVTGHPPRTVPTVYALYDVIYYNIMIILDI